MELNIFKDILKLYLLLIFVCNLSNENEIIKEPFQRTEKIFKAIIAPKFGIIFAFTSKTIFSIKQDGFQMISYQNLTYELLDYQKETINLLDISDFGENFEHIYIIVANCLYHIDKTGNFISYYTKVSIGNLIEMSAYNILLDKCYIDDSHKYCDLYLVDIDLENNVNIIYFIHDFDKRELNKDFDLITPEDDILIKNKNISCQMMYDAKKDEKLMTCFYVNVEHQLQTIFFYPLEPSSMEIYLCSAIELSDSNVAYLKSALYSNN